VSVTNKASAQDAVVPTASATGLIIPAQSLLSDIDGGNPAILGAQPTWRKKKIETSSTAVGGVNTVTITFRPTVTFIEGDPIVVAGLVGTQTSSSDSIRIDGASALKFSVNGMQQRGALMQNTGRITLKVHTGYTLSTTEDTEISFAITNKASADSGVTPIIAAITETLRVSAMATADLATQVTLMYNRPLDTDPAPRKESFSIKSVVGASTTYPTIDSATINGECELKLTLASSLSPSATVTVSYTAGGGYVITGDDSNSTHDDAVNFADASVTNYIEIDSAAPVLQSIQVVPNDPKLIQMVFNESLLNARACTFEDSVNKHINSAAWVVTTGTGFTFKQCQFLCCSDPMCKSFDYKGSLEGSTTQNCEVMHYAVGDTGFPSLETSTGWTPLPLPPPPIPCGPFPVCCAPSLWLGQRSYQSK
jgi:hypothetical protein